MTEAISLIEAHDGTVSNLEISRASELVIEFGHLAVYLQVADERFEIWSHRAELLLRGVSELSLVGRLADHDHRIDAAVKNEDERKIAWAKLLRETKARDLLLQLLLGATVQIRFEEARLDLGDKLCLVERWEGPSEHRDNAIPLGVATSLQAGCCQKKRFIREMRRCEFQQAWPVGRVCARVGG